MRAEDRWVPRPLYRRERRRILESFLHRERIFLTDTFHERHEMPALGYPERAIAAMT